MADSNGTGKAGKVSTSINLPEDLLEDLDKVQRIRHLNRTDKIILCLCEWVELERDPAIMADRIRTAIRKDPSILKGLVDEQVRMTVREMLERK